jgi:DNA replication protein DnaC
VARQHGRVADVLGDQFKPMADFDWSWPAKIERDVIERALTLDFLPEARNLILMGPNGLGKDGVLYRLPSHNTIFL